MIEETMSTSENPSQPQVMPRLSDEESRVLVSNRRKLVVNTVVGGVAGFAAFQSLKNINGLGWLTKRPYVLPVCGIMLGCSYGSKERTRSVLMLENSIVAERLRANIRTRMNMTDEQINQMFNVPATSQMNAGGVGTSFSVPASNADDFDSPLNRRLSREKQNHEIHGTYTDTSSHGANDTFTSGS